MCFDSYTYFVLTLFFKIFGIFEVQRKKVQELVPTKDINGISNKEPFEIETSSEQSSSSFLDPAIAVADIDTFFVAEGQTLNII